MIFKTITILADYNIFNYQIKNAESHSQVIYLLPAHPQSQRTHTEGEDPAHRPGNPTQILVERPKKAAVRGVRSVQQISAVELPHQRER